MLFKRGLCFFLPGSTIGKMLVDRQYMGVSKRKCIIWGVAFLSDGTVISVDSAGKVQIWDSATGTLVKNHLVSNADVQSIAVSAVSIAPLGQFLSTLGRGGEKAASVLCHQRCSLILSVVVEEDELRAVCLKTHRICLNSYSPTDRE